MYLGDYSENEREYGDPMVREEVLKIIRDYGGITPYLASIHDKIDLLILQSKGIESIDIPFGVETDNNKYSNIIGLYGGITLFENNIKNEDSLILFLEEGIPSVDNSLKIEDILQIFLKAFKKAFKGKTTRGEYIYDFIYKFMIFSGINGENSSKMLLMLLENKKFIFDLGGDMLSCILINNLKDIEFKADFFIKNPHILQFLFENTLSKSTLLFTVNEINFGEGELFILLKSRYFRDIIKKMQDSVYIILLVDIIKNVVNQNNVTEIFSIPEIKWILKNNLFSQRFVNILEEYGIEDEQSKKNKEIRKRLRHFVELEKERNN